MSFNSDRDLKKIGNRGGQRDDAVARARKQRELREKSRNNTKHAVCIQKFLRGRSTASKQKSEWRQMWDKKMSDIEKLRAIIGPTFLPDANNTTLLLKQLLIFFTPDDCERLTLFCTSLLLPCLKSPDPVFNIKFVGIGNQWERTIQMYRLLKLVMCCLRVTLADFLVVGRTPNSVLIDSVLALLGLTVMDTGELEERKREPETLDDTNRMLVSRVVAKAGLFSIVRRILLTAPSPAAAELTVTQRSRFDGIWRLVVGVLTCTPSAIPRSSYAEFVVQVMTVPLLPHILRTGALGELASPARSQTWQLLLGSFADLQPPLPESPLDAVGSDVCLLGNLLSACRFAQPLRMESALLSLQLRVVADLLEVVPQGCYAGGQVLSWAVSGGSHVPLVMSDRLRDQLLLLTAEQQVRELALRSLRISDQQLRRLQHRQDVRQEREDEAAAEAAQRQRMSLSASATASVSSFFASVGAYGSASSSSTSSCSTPSSVWASASRWGQKLLGRRRSSGAGPGGGGGGGRGGVAEAKHSGGGAGAGGSGGGGGGSEEKCIAESKQQGGGEEGEEKEGEGFDAPLALAFCRLCALVLQRWSPYASTAAPAAVAAQRDRGVRAPSPASVSLLNTLAFSTDLVPRLWALLRGDEGGPNIGGGAQGLKALREVRDPRVTPCAGPMAALVLLCCCFDQLLAVLDDVEMYDKQSPLKLLQLAALVRTVRDVLAKSYWQSVEVAAPLRERGLDRFGAFLKMALTRFMRQLHSRCCRRPFTPADTWLATEFRGERAQQQLCGSGSGSGGERSEAAHQVLRCVPFLLAFEPRARMFDRSMTQRRVAVQGTPEARLGQPLRVHIRRSYLVEDCISQINRLGPHLSHRVHVVFSNAAGTEEAGIDAGGLFKELWTELSAVVFDVQFGLFAASPDGLLYPSPLSRAAHGEGHLALFEFLGRVLGKALFEGLTVQPQFAHFFLSRLLGRFNSINDLPSLDLDLYRNLMFLKTYEGDVADLCLDFTVSVEQLGERRVVPLLPRGADMPVTATNRLRYIYLVADFHLNVQIRAQCDAFLRGLRELVPMDYLSMFSEPELQVLVSGAGGGFDVDDMRAHVTLSGGFSHRDATLTRFWKAVASMTPEEQALLLRFATSCSRLPPLGFAAMQPPFCLHRVPVRSDDERLPSASTCFNTLKLPTFSSTRVMKEKLIISIRSGAGFEMS